MYIGINASATVAPIAKIVLIIHKAAKGAIGKLYNESRCLLFLIEIFYLLVAAMGATARGCTTAGPIVTCCPKGTAIAPFGGATGAGARGLTTAGPTDICCPKGTAEAIVLSNGLLMNE